MNRVFGELPTHPTRYFEWHVATEQATQYYFADATRIGMRTDAGGLQFILGDHLGSTSVMADPSGSLLSSQGYMPWGETRFGSVGTEYQYTGQYRQAAIGLDYFNARWYDPALGRWNQPDTIIQDYYYSQDWDLSGYVNNSPIIYNDPSGHADTDGCITEGCATDEEKRNNENNPVIEKIIKQHENDSQLNLGGNASG